MRRTDDDLVTLEVTAIVGHMRIGALLEYQVQIPVILRLFVFDLWAIMANTAQTDHATLQP